MTKKKNKVTVRIRFEDGSGVCVGLPVEKAVAHGESLDRGAVVVIEDADTDEVLWQAELTE